MSYTADIDAVDEDRWHRLVHRFADANIFQTWTYGATRWGEKNLSHAVVKDGGEVVGLAQAVLVGMPPFGKRLAYVICGPLWQPRTAPRKVEHLRAALDALRQEYAVRRGLCLRIRPWSFEEADDLRAAMPAEGIWRQAGPLHTTFVLDLSLPERELRRAMDRKWRANLRKSERCGLSVSLEDGPEGVRRFADVHRQMRQRKRLSAESVALLGPLCERLPREFRPRIFVCRHDGVPVAAAVVSAIGNGAVYLNGANGDAGLEVRAGYFLQWAIVRWLKENAPSRWYDLHGAGASPGVRQFKRGLVGARAPERPVVEFQTWENRLSVCLADAGFAARRPVHRARRALKSHLDRFRPL